MEFLWYLGPGLAIGLAGIGVAIGQGILVKKTMEVMSDRPSMSSFYLTISILGVALLESALIYSLVVSFQIFGNESISAYSSIAAGLAIGLAGAGAGIGEGFLVSGALGAIGKRSDSKNRVMTFMVLFIALVESVAIYGLVFAFRVMGNTGIDGGLAIGAGLAIGLAGLGVAIGQGTLAKKSIELMGENEAMSNSYLAVSILSIALVESAAIYGLVIAFQLISPDVIMSMYGAIGAGLAVGLSGLGVGVGQGKLVVGALGAIGKRSDSKNRVMTFMVLFIALVESVAIYGLVFAFRVMGNTGIDGGLAIGAGLAIGLAGLGVAIGQGTLAKKSIELMGENEAMSNSYLAVSILSIALVESAAIYGLVIAFQLISPDVIMSMYGAIGAGLAVGLSGLGVGVGQGRLVVGALKAISKRPLLKNKIMTLMVLFVALVEVTAIYGLIISFNIIGGLENYDLAIGAGLAIGLAGLGVAIGRGYMSEKTMEVIGDNNKMTNFFMTISILGVALIESAAIYGLVIAFQLISPGIIMSIYGSIGAGLAIGLSGLGVGIGQGRLIVGALGAINRNPEIKNKIMTFMVLFIALIEVTAIYGLIIVFNIMGGLENHDMAIGAGLAIGLAGLGVAIGRGYMSETAIYTMGKNSKMMGYFLTVSILGVALIESAAIYGLIISFQILASNGLIGIYGLMGAGLAIGLASIGVGVGEGFLIKGAINGINNSPDNKGKSMAFMTLFIAMVESAAIYGLIISFLILSN
ncbi:hypothetical protein [Candidatus Vampirococcus lugosii]|uniref:ATP synthase subunit c n=1 Tax=Candidatus Vampirococcus lugosii TaxID=2789015 RepID=A0ABS5QLA5_9BACT|nr:hypothetical protein [Candidatus Vampirococcus lugosii]MBS8121779.1 FoF1-type ATP synthase, membrane subunit c/Archaeal/vacuolar-type H+-ATPase, subunit K [Candidatus Vampirococcus lugosii]